MDDDDSGTGQQAGTLTRVTAWAQHPFSSDMDAFHWFLWLGLILLSALVWHFMLDKFIGD